MPCSVPLPHDAMSLSAVCNCGISSSYALTFLIKYMHHDIFFLFAVISQYISIPFLIDRLIHCMI